MTNDISKPARVRMGAGKILFILMAVGSFVIAAYLVLFPASLGLGQADALFIALALVASGLVDAVLAWKWDRITAR